MKVLVIHQHYCPENGIGNNRTGEIFEHWVSQGHTIEIITSLSAFPKNHPARIKKQIHSFEEKGMRIHVIPIGYSHFNSFYKRILSFLRFFYQTYAYGKTLAKPDLVYGISTPPSVAEVAYRLAKRWQVPWFFETVDVWPDVPIGMNILSPHGIAQYISTRVDFLYRQASGIIALSPGMKQQIQNHGIPLDKIFVSYNGTNSKLFHFYHRTVKDKLIFLYAGTIGRANDISFILQVAERCLDLPVLFHIIGDGQESYRIKDYIAQYQPVNVKYTPAIPKNQMNDVFKEADVGIVCFAHYPVLEHNSANKFYDYLMAGLPVIINYEGWQKEVLETQHCGKSSKSGDIEAFCRNIAWFCQHDSEIETMKINAYQYAQAHYDRKTLSLALENWVLEQMKKKHK